MKNNHLIISSFLIAIYVLCFFQIVFAAEVVLKNGRTFQAKIVKITDEDMILNVNGIEMKYLRSDIRSVNGIEEISTEKLRGLVSLAYQKSKEATQTQARDKAKCEEAVEIVKKIDELDLPDMPVSADVVEIMKRCKRHTDSLVYIQKELNKNPQDAKAHLEMANVYRHDAGKFKEAIDEYEKVIAIQGPTAHNQFEIGWTYMIYGKYDQAIPYFEKVIKSNPDFENLEIYDKLGSCYLAVGRPEEALDVFQKYLERSPDDDRGDAYHNLGLAYQAMGQNVKAADFESKAKDVGHTD